MDFRAVKLHGFLVDDEVGFSGESMLFSPLVRYTWRSSFVSIKPDGVANMMFAALPTSSPYTVAGLRLSVGQTLPNLDIEFDLQLRREPQVGGSEEIRNARAADRH
jgi:hypothetical protein